MADELELETVLEFLRKNGLSECESALMEDILEKSNRGQQLGSSDLEKFIFPMVPPPPPLRIPITRPPEEEFSGVGGGGGGSSKGSSSDDEFVSLGSSTTELCSSEFTNPYGIRTTRPTSQASSDRLSQFGTARDYPDFDMQNDLFWYTEKDEDFAMPPPFGDIDFGVEPSQDKYVMTVQAEERTKDPIEYNFTSDWRTELLEHKLDLTTREGLKNEAYKDYYELGEHFPLEESETNFYTKRESTFDWFGSFDNTEDLHTVEKDKQLNEKDDLDCVYDEIVVGEPGDEKGGDISDELLIYENKEDDYEIFNLRIIHRKNRTGFEENKDFPIVLNSIIAGRYYVTEFLGSAAFSKVVQAHDLYTGMDVCLKIIKNDKDFFDQSLDEIKLLKFVNKHDPADEHHILRLYDYFYHQEHLFIVTELLRANLYEFQKYNRESGGELYFTMHRLQIITRQCLEALVYLHGLGIIHCDLKPENILIKSYRRCEIKVIDLGSSCFHTDHLSLYVQSRSYRAPEVMLGLPYDHKIDLWSVGCILAELYSGEVLFPNEPVVMLLARMVAMLGPFDPGMLQKGQEAYKYFTEENDLYYMNEDTDQLEYIILEKSSLEHHLGISDRGFLNFLKYLLQINPKRRPTAKEALDHPWLSHKYEMSSY